MAKSSSKRVKFTKQPKSKTSQKQSTKRTAENYKILAKLKD